jgi:hypothetical protein
VGLEADLQVVGYVEDGVGAQVLVAPLLLVSRLFPSMISEIAGRPDRSRVPW